MSKREECRKCGAKLKHDQTLDQYDPEYCSGKCRKEDGAEPYVKSEAEKAAVIVEVKKKKTASLDGYKKGVPANYARRFEPEKLNWSANKMSEAELKQAGFRANREPIPGDWDYEEVEVQSVAPEEQAIAKEPTAWELIKARAKELDIKVFGKTKEAVVAEIAAKEADNA